MSSPDSNFDAWLDTELRNVPLPAGMLARLQKVAELSDEELDADLQAVAIPAGLARRLQRIGEREARRMRLHHAAMAALLLMAVGLGYLGLTISFLGSLRPSQPPAAHHLASQLKLKPSEEPPVEIGDLAIALDSDPEASPEPWPAGAESALSFSLEGQAARSAPEWELPENADLMTDRNMALWPLGSPVDNGDALEDLKKVAGLRPRGIDFPLVYGYDVAFLSRTGFHPFVAPALNPQLRSLVAPLGGDTESYDLARRYLDDGELPPRSELRTEEFLAAIDYQYPRPTKQALGLFVAGGPSPFHANGLQLLQLGVQAKNASPSHRPAARLTLVVDTSGSMSWGGRIEMIRQAFGRFAERMLPNDRVSLVVFSDKSYALVEDASRQQRDQLKAAIATLPTDGPTNLAAGLRTAYGLAQRVTPSTELANRVVLLTDGLAGMDEATAMQIDRRLKEAAVSGVQLHVVDLSQEREEVEPPPFLSRLASKGGGRVHRATSVDQIGWALEAILTGHSQRVAADAQLRVTFNPKAVEVYRLLGHEPRTVISLKPAHPEADFYTGQAATVLCELRLLPNGANDIALLELTWRDPLSGESHRINQTVQRGQFVASLHQTPLPLQAATMVAEAAEQLRGSLPLFNPTWPSAGSLESVRQLSRQVDSRLLERPTYSAFLALLEKAATARPYRGGGDARARFWRENGK
jgi:Ca-activated chloride channel family protein